MILFSEKVTPTFTSSNQNILTIKDFNEVFFDVYELEINGNKYIAEKISEYKGNPVVNIPLVIEGKELEAPFVIQRGEFEVIFNESNSTFIGLASSKPEEVFIEEKSRSEEVEEIIFEKKESILEEIKQARQAATKFADSIQQKNLRRLEERNNRDQEIFVESAENFKKVLLEEFLSVSENTREELFTYTQQENTKAFEYITDTVSQLAEKLTQDLNEEVNSRNDETIKLFEKNIYSLAKNILTDKLLKKIATNNIENTKATDIKFETISKTLTKLLGDYEVQLDEKIKETLDSYESHFVTLEKSNIELNDAIVKSSNKALSRIGNVKTSLEESIDNISSELKGKITLAEDKIKDYYDERINLIEASVIDITSKDKAHIIELIEESKQSILKEVDIIKGTVPYIVTEKTLETKGDVDVKKIKTDLEKSISNRFTQELANVRRIIELSSGGGSVAVQFANGGTMNGTLNVTGQYLSGGVDLSDIIANSGDIVVDTLVRSSSGNWNRAYNTSTVYQVNSASYATIDFTNSKFFPLSGGTITGDTRFNSNVTIFGNLTTTGTTTFANTVFSVTSALSVVHIGTGPAVWVGNFGTGDIASFYDIDQNIEVLHVGGINSTNPNVGIKTSTPNKTFTVVGEISATSDITTSGTSNRLPNQIADTSDSILTRQLADDRYYINDNASSIIGISMFI